MDYQEFLASKFRAAEASGFEVDESSLPPALFPFQRAIVKWALRRGRAAIFADCGMGKTIMQLAWAREVTRHTSGKVLILAPLAVAEQTVEEARRFGIDAAHSRDGAITSDVTVTNYEMLHHFSAADFSGIVLDESSILKAYDGATRNAIIGAFAFTPYRLACTATPAPNDFTELGNHSEFLGVMSRVEMLSEFFVHDGGSTQDWRIKGHARESFWRWVCSWGLMVRKPSDLGFDDAGFDLPPLEFREHVVEESDDDARREGLLFAADAVTLAQQRAVRRATMDHRVKLAADIAANADGACVVWCELNAEADACEAAIHGAIQVAGSDSAELKVGALTAFAHGDARVMVSKASICGHGMNWQHCNTMIFVGASHSYEQVYQAVRRCWRFGQKRPVTVHIIRANTEGAIVANLKRKEADAATLASEMVNYMSHFQHVGIGAERLVNEYRAARPMEIPIWM